MKSQLTSFLLISSLFLSFQTQAETETELSIDDATLSELAKRYNIQLSVLNDFVDSYNFKCPQELSTENLISILNTEDDDTELSVMLESDRLAWRDIYVEARSGISCLHQGIVSKGY